MAKQSKEKPELKPVEYDVHNFNVILKLIWKFTQAIELNESFIVYLVLRFRVFCVCVCVRAHSFIRSLFLRLLFLFGWWNDNGMGELFVFSLYTPLSQMIPHCTHHSTRTWLKSTREKNERIKTSFWLFIFSCMNEWNESISTAHVA